MELRLNNGHTVTYKGLDEWSRPIIHYKHPKSKKLYKLVIVDNKMHTTTKDGEPDYPLTTDYRLKEYDYDFQVGDFIYKGNIR